MHVLSSRVVIHPTDLSRSRAFYETVIGLHIYREWGVGIAYFLGGGFLELSAADPRGDLDRPASARPGATTLWLQVPTLGGVEDRLAEAGVPIRQTTATMPWGLIELWAEDPDGNELRFVEVPANHPLRHR